jgi:hypothetical protein
VSNPPADGEGHQVKEQRNLCDQCKMASKLVALISFTPCCRKCQSMFNCIVGWLLNWTYSVQKAILVSLLAPFFVDSLVTNTYKFENVIERKVGCAARITHGRV